MNPIAITTQRTENEMMIFSSEYLGQTIFQVSPYMGILPNPSASPYCEDTLKIYEIFLKNQEDLYI